jgi:hypothetical protein
MSWNFSFGWMFLGILIIAAGAAMVVYHQKIADALLGGVHSYDKVKLYAIITILVGLAVMANLHTLLLTMFVNLIFKR